VSPPNHTLFYSIHGQGKFRVPSGEMLLDEGQLIILPAGQSFEVTIVSEQWDIIWVNLADSERWTPFNKLGAVIVDNAMLEGLHHAMELLYLERDVENRNSAMQVVSRYLYRIIDAPLSDVHTHDEKERRQVSRLHSLFSAVEKQLQFDWDMESLSEKAYKYLGEAPNNTLSICV
jgi:hypothetical protein